MEGPGSASPILSIPPEHFRIWNGQSGHGKPGLALHRWTTDTRFWTSRQPGKTTGNFQTFMAAYAEGRSNSKLNDRNRTNKFESLRPPQPHASGSAGADGACLAGRKNSHAFVVRVYVLLKFAVQRGAAPAIFLVVQVGHLRIPLRKLSDCGTAS